MNVLLVEDNQADAELLMEIFAEKSPNLHVNWINDGGDALDFVTRPLETHLEEPDLVLLDLSLPRISGYDVLRGLKLNVSARKIPVIILSTSNNPDDAIECKKLGAVAYLSKPSTLAEYENLAHCLIAAEMPKYICGNF